MNNYEEMAKTFEVEELEERLEFRKWKAKGELKVEVECNTGSGCDVGGKGTITIS